MKLFSFIVALLVYSTAFGQNDYVVTLRSDTLRGEIRILSYDMIDRVQIGSGKSKQVFTAVQLRNAHQGGDMFVPIKHDNTIRLMKVIRSGYMSLYGYRMQNQSRYDGRLIVKMGNPPTELPNIGFKRAMGALMEDCPVVADRIKNGSYERTDVEAIIDDYNKCVTDGQDRRVENATVKVSNATTDFIDELRVRVNASDFTSKADINDLLNGIADKVRKKEPVPGYMKEGLKGYLSSKPEFKEDVDQLMMLLEN